MRIAMIGAAIGLALAGAAVSAQQNTPAMAPVGARVPGDRPGIGDAGRARPYHYHGTYHRRCRTVYYHGRRMRRCR